MSSITHKLNLDKEIHREISEKSGIQRSTIACALINIKRPLSCGIGVRSGCPRSITTGQGRVLIIIYNKDKSKTYNN